MAEIRIQEKKRPIWPWIVLILLIAAVVAWYLLENRRTGIMDNDREINDTTETGSLPADTLENGAQKEVDNFVAFLRQNDTVKTVDPAYVHEGLDHLNSAIKAVISEKNITDSSMVVNSDSLSKFASEAGNDVKRSNNIRSAFISAANIIEDIQEKQEPGMKSQADDLLKKARAINASESIVEQSPKVKEFFNRAGEILLSMINKDV